MKARSLEPLADAYVVDLMSTLKRRATRKQHTNVLQHLLGFCSNAIDPGDRAEMTGMIEQYRQGPMPLVVPITMLKHHFRRHPNHYVQGQHYLAPHRSELMLRNLI